MDSQMQITELVDSQQLEQLNLLAMSSAANIGVLCNGDNYNSPQSHHLVSTNSFELNAATSLSDDSGVPLTNSSISSGDSYRLGLCKFELELVESDGEVSQFDSLDNCSDGGMSAENFNTLKKGPLAPIDPPPEFQDSPHTTLLRSQALQNYALKFTKNLISDAVLLWSHNYNFCYNTFSAEVDATNFECKKPGMNVYSKHIYASDSLLNKHIDNIYDEPNDNSCSSYENSLDIVSKDLCENFENQSRYFKVIKSEQDHSKSRKLNLARLSEIQDYDIYYGLKKCHPSDSFQQRKTPVLYSPLHHTGSNISTGNRPNSRNSLNSRLSSSHNSLSVPNANKADDSIFITQAMSHDALLGREISDFYNVPIDSDIYAFPIDMITPESKDSSFRRDTTKMQKCRSKYTRNNKKRRRNNASEATGMEKYGTKVKISRSGDKRHSVPENTLQPLNMTLDQVKRFYHSLYSSSSDSNETLNNKNSTIQNRKNSVNSSSNTRNNNEKNVSIQSTTAITIKSSNYKNISNGKTKKLMSKTEIQPSTNNNTMNNNKFSTQSEKKSQFSITLNLKQKFCSIFRFRKNHHNSGRQNLVETAEYVSNRVTDMNGTTRLREDKKKKFSTRALPPLPNKHSLEKSETTEEKKEDKKPEFNSAIHFAANIEKVKNYGWYWGPISSEAAEKILSNEPDGSFIVRDSSDDHYIFSLSFKLNNCVRHVRIEQDQGTFSFGSYAKFKSQTITGFIEKAVEHSRSGRYLFFLHRRPEHGPMRVQLTNPVSRFKHIQSLQHMCRFVILMAVVRKDLIQTLPLPRRLLDYLSYKHCYSEQVESDSSQSQMSGDGRA